MSEVEVVSRPVSPSFTSIPEEIKEFFAAKGKRLGLVFAHPMNAGVVRAYGREVVLLEDLPSELHRVARSAFDRPEKYDGELRRGDCVLVAQSLEEREMWEGEFERRRLMTEDDARFSAEALQDELRAKLPREGSGWVQIRPEQVRPITEHVSGGPDFARKVQQELAGSSPGSQKPNRR